MTGPASGPFAGFRFHRLLSVPARGEDEPHRLPAALMSALTEEGVLR